MSDVLLTVSGVIADDIDSRIATGQRPRADYIEMAKAFDADLLDYSRAREQTGWIGRVLEWFGGANLLVAWACFLVRNRYSTIFTDGEQVGIPLAIFSRFGGKGSMRHLMIAHILSVGKKMLFFRLFKLQRQIDLFFVYSTWQKWFIQQQWQVPTERIIFTPFMVDQHFFSLEEVTSRPRCMICAVGLEFRDYPTLLQAVSGLDVEVVIAAASPWSKRSDSTQDQMIPRNVTVRKFSQYELRQLYADCRFVVMPLYDVEFQAGVTAILEAMSMERAVICSQTSGQTDVIIDNETGIYVKPEDPMALREAIVNLLGNPEKAAALGKSGRELIEEEMHLDHYVDRLTRYVNQTTQTSTTQLVNNSSPTSTSVVNAEVIDRLY